MESNEVQKLTANCFLWKKENIKVTNPDIPLNYDAKPLPAYLLFTNKSSY